MLTRCGATSTRTKSSRTRATPTRTRTIQEQDKNSLSLSVLTAILQVNLGQLVFIEAKDDGGGGDN